MRQFRCRRGGGRHENRVYALLFYFRIVSTIVTLSISMSFIIAKLPTDVVDVIKSYVFDMETRIAVLLQGCIDRDHTFTLTKLFSKLTPKQLETIFLKGSRTHFFYSQNGLHFHGTETYKMIMPTIKYQTWSYSDLSHSLPIYERSEDHPVHHSLQYFTCPVLFGNEKSKRIERVIFLINFLRYTAIGHRPFDDYIRKMAYNMLAGSIVMHTEHKPIAYVNQPLKPGPPSCSKK